MYVTLEHEILAPEAYCVLAHCTRMSGQMTVNQIFQLFFFKNNNNNKSEIQLFIFIFGSNAKMYFNEHKRKDFHMELLLYKQAYNGSSYLWDNKISNICTLKSLIARFTFPWNIIVLQLAPLKKFWKVKVLNIYKDSIWKSFLLLCFVLFFETFKD